MARAHHPRTAYRVAFMTALTAAFLGVGSGWLVQTLAQENVTPEAPTPEETLSPADQVSPDSLPTIEPTAPLDPAPPTRPQADLIRSELRQLRQDIIQILIQVDTLEALIEQGEALHQESSTQAEIVREDPVLPATPEPLATETAEDPLPEASVPTSPNPSENLTTFDVGSQTISLPGDVLFDFDQSTLRAEASNLLQRVASRLSEQDSGRVLVTGHTDNIGEENYNLVLSLERANTVKDFLIDQMPNADQFNWSSSGFGAAQPIASNDTESGRQRNRRVDIIIAP